ncbi:hypothetical protein VNI00_011622 [Paramarasmius palmivorus]|uniref:Nitroreductase domain-containing protein n=1 Tax=Paramarasmius palmivorus TaxID=297713 RepID=A0AAW0CCS1_9AGAR
MKSRFSCRFYLPKPVPQKIIEEIVDAARFAPSGNNMQPWEKVYCISGDVKDTICKAMLEAHIQNPTDYVSQYHYYPEGHTPDQYATRRQEFGKVHYTALNIDRSDYSARAESSNRNYDFYGAPVAFVFTIHQDLTQGSWLDVGCFIQNMILASRTRGLASVCQESISKYHQVLRRYLPIAAHEIVAVGMAVGYPDLEKVAQYHGHQPKRAVSDIIEFHGFDQ